MGVAPRGCQPRTVSHDSTTQRAYGDKRKASRVRTRPRCSRKARQYAVTSDNGEQLSLAAVQEIVEHPGAELQRRDRDSLVHAMEHAREVELRRQPQRREAEAANSQPRE